MSDTPEKLPDLTEYELPHHPWVLAGAVIIAPFMEVLDTTITNVALPHIAGNLSASADESTWVLTSYLVSNAIVLPLGGWFSSLFGRKQFYLACVILFTSASFLCGLAPNIELLVFYRILQGAGGGALQPIAQSILVESFPKEKRGMAMALFGVCVIIAPIIGPTLGGWITDNYNWRWVFFINIPVGILAVFLGMLLVHNPPYLVRKKIGQDFKIDYIGLGFIAVGLGALQIILDKGEREDWFDSHFIVTLTIICVGMLNRGSFLGVETKRPCYKTSNTQRPQFDPRCYCDLRHRVCIIRKHRVTADVFAKFDGVLSNGQRFGDIARRHNHNDFDAISGASGSKGSGKMASYSRFNIRRNRSFYIRTIHVANQLLGCGLVKDCYVRRTWVFIYPHQCRGLLLYSENRH